MSEHELTFLKKWPPCSEGAARHRHFRAPVLSCGGGGGSGGHGERPPGTVLPTCAAECVRPKSPQTVKEAKEGQQLWSPPPGPVRFVLTFCNEM